jgi:hypothetical protein
MQWWWWNISQMDSGEASSQHSSSRTEKNFLVEHNMPFWSAQRDNSRQHKAIRLSHIQGFLSSNGGRSSFCISISPSVQWSIGKSECTDIYSHKEDIRESAERQMGGRIAKSSMESQHLSLQSNEIHPFQIVVQRRASNPGGNLAPQRQNKDGGHLQSQRS